MKKTVITILAAVMAFVMAFTFAGCSNSFDPDKQITVVARELASGTREAFDKVVTDGTHYLQEKDENGEKVYRTTDKAVVLSKTGDVLTKVSSEKQAIGYISLGSVNDSIKTVKVEGVAPSSATVLDGTYKIQRPFVVMTNNSVTLTPVAQDFMNYLMSSASQQHCDKAGTVYLSDPAQRGNEGSPIEVVEYTKQASLPSGGKIIIRGSTSMEKFIESAMAAYAELYGVSDPLTIFDIELQGSSTGVSAVENDTAGSTIGLSSAAVVNDKITSFNVCLDAVAVIVNNANDIVDDLTLNELYQIYTGNITKFSELTK